MLTSEKIKKYAKSLGADIIGVASYDRFDGAPKQLDPRYMFPDGKAIIVLGFRHFRGVFRGIEEGTFWTSYCSMGYASINFIQQPLVLWNVCKMIEDEGYEALPIPNNFPWGAANCYNPPRVANGNYPANPGYSINVSPEKPHPNVFIHMRLSAFAAGLGDIGYNKMFLSPQFGPRQRLAAIITEAPLVPDPMPEERICDRCKMCVKACTVQAIPSDKTIKVRVAGQDVEWADIDMNKCAFGFQGATPETNPFIVTHEDVEGYMGPKTGNYKTPSLYHYARALEGASGCIRACMIHLEQKGKIHNQFKEPFRKRKPWKLPQV